MNKRRLLTLATHLEKLADTPKKKLKVSFDTEHYWREGSCGTSACAAGHAASIPSFKRAGYTLKHTLIWSEDSECRFSMPCFAGLDGRHAIACFFGLDESDSHDFGLVNKIFFSDGKTTPRQKAKQIRRLVEKEAA